MRIMMFTNLYYPVVGGVTKSVERFATAFGEKGHETLIVAPTFPDQPAREEGVLRVNAWQNFAGTKFSVSLPLKLNLSEALEEFAPEIIHSHHPFLLGDDALRAAASTNTPLILTYHTMYEHYTHYFPGDSEGMKKFVLELCLFYANLCNRVIAPTGSVERILEERGVETPIAVIPTGIDFDRFADGDGTAARERRGLSSEGFVVGHVGRLTPEKNLGFLTNAMARFLKKNAQTHALIVGDGDAKKTMEAVLAEEGLTERATFTGVLQGRDLVDAYHAMDLFAFASKSETQGMVLAEAMAADLPVVALDANGVRDIVDDGKNGRLVMEESVEVFAETLQKVHDLDRSGREALQQGAHATAKSMSIAASAEKMLSLYARVLAEEGDERDYENSDWASLMRLMWREWKLWGNRLTALTDAISGGLVERRESDEG